MLKLSYPIDEAGLPCRIGKICHFETVCAKRDSVRPYFGTKYAYLGTK